MRRGLLLIALAGALICLCSCSDTGVSQKAETEPQTKRETETAPETETATVTETEPPSSTEPESEEPAEKTAVFFGKKMPEEVAEVNRKTLSDPKSMLFDLFSDELYTAGRIIEMINEYSIPEGGFLGADPAGETLRHAVTANRNLQTLYDRRDGKSAASPVIQERYGILVTNASVRSFPTKLRFTSSGKVTEFDLFQETVLPFASGVHVLHESSDGKYFFCQGEYYHGWIDKEEIALTDRETFLEFLSPETFAVSLGTDESVSWNRLGLILPVSASTDTELVLRLPERTAEGGLGFSEIAVDRNSGRYHVGFLPFSGEKATEIALSLLGTPYGWGDEHGFYDCSGFTGALYRVFGYYLPRNSSILDRFGGKKIDLRGMDIEEKKALLRYYPGAVLSWPGHAMYFSGAVVKDGTERFEIIQEGTGWCDVSGVFADTNSVTVSNLTEMYRTNGKSFLESIETLVVAD